jgi:hypothetical protein
MASRRETQPTQPEPEVLPPTDDLGEEDRELEDSGTLVKLNKGELEMQMEFARKFPRVLSKVLKTLTDRVTHTPAIAIEMNYSVPRGGKQIMGASSRFAEILASSWGNCLTLCRVVGVDAEFVRAQGVYFDCESNYRHGREVARRITGSDNRRFNADMIQVTGQAASSIAFRNATLNGIGKGIWYDAYLKSREVAIGTAESQVQTRNECLEWAKQAGITGEMLFSTLQVQGVQDIIGEKLLALKVMRKEVMAGEKSIDEVFGTMETANIEAAMSQIGWNEGQKTVSRQAYRGRPSEHLAYLKEQIDIAQRRGVSTAAPATKTAPAKTAPAKDAPKPASNAADAAEMPRAEQTTVGGGSEVAASDGAETLPEKKPAASTKGGKFDF